MGKEKISIENGRWGPFIKFGKGMFKIPKKEDGSKYDAEELQTVSLDEVKKWITDQDKTAFAEKKKPAGRNLQRRRNNFVSRNVERFYAKSAKIFIKYYQ